MPFHRVHKWLHESVESILNQTYSELELLLIDDRPENGPPINISGDRRVRCIKNEGKGLPQALNTGLYEAKGDIIARMDSDDISHPSRLARQHKLLMNLQDLAATSCLVMVPAKRSNPGMARYISWSNQITDSEQINLNRFSGSPIIHPTIMAPRKLFTLLGPYRWNDQPEDYELWLRWLHFGVKIQKVPEPLYHWRDHSARLTRTSPRYHKIKFQQLKAHYFKMWLHQKYDQAEFPLIYACGTGNNAKQISKALMAEGIIIQGYLDLGRRKKFMGKPVFTYDNLPDEAEFILNMVGDLKGKQAVSEFCSDRGFIEGLNYFTFI